MMQPTCNYYRRRTLLLRFFVILTTIISSSSAGLIDGSVDQEDYNDDDSNTNTNESSSKSSSSSNSNNWWRTMFEGLPGDIDIAQPANRRGHSATHFIDKHNTEWMIVSGGFTDEDWHSMPVWAYDLTTGMEMEQFREKSTEEQVGYEWDIDKIELYEHPWVSMVFDTNKGRSGSGEQQQQQPQGRVGHLSSTYNDCLYIFGGLTYSFGFSVEYPDNGYNSLVVWKGCGLNHYLKKREGLVWEKIVPTVHGQYPVEPEPEPEGSGSDDNRATSVNTTSEEGGDNSNNHDHGRSRRNLQGRRLPPVPDGVIITNNKKKNDGEQGPKTTPKKPTVNLSILPRGELQGGHYAPQDDNKEYFIFHGGVIQGDLETTGEVALGDVWKYDYEDNSLTMLAPYPPLQWQRDERTQLYPMARTAHAATVVGDELIIHGGMHPSEDILDQMSSSSFSSPSDSYATYKTHSKWKPLSDVWVFNLKTLKWKERVHFPQMARSYHTLVGWGNGEIAAFGGFQQDTSQYSSDTVVFVFKDLLLSRPNETYWLKLLPPGAEQISYSLVRQSYRNNYLLGITNRLEHSAILDNSGSMIVWGGRFQTVGQISGLWRLDVFTKDANLNLEMAPPDGIEAYERELEALHLFLVTMMFMSLTISSLLSSMRRRGEEQEIIERSSHRRGGLSQDVIDSLPTKRYEAPRRSVTDDGDVVEDVSLSRENSMEDNDLQLDNADCCAICLVDYEEGVSEIRTLPCGHAFDKECIDSWLEGHTTCPACRQGIENTPLSPRSEAANTTIRNGSILFTSWLSPNTGIWSPIGANETGSISTIPEVATSDTSNDDDNVGVQVADSRRRGLFRFFNRRVHEPLPAPTLNEFELV